MDSKRPRVRGGVCRWARGVDGSAAWSRTPEPHSFDRASVGVVCLRFAGQPMQHPSVHRLPNCGDIKERARVEPSGKPLIRMGARKGTIWRMDARGLALRG